jgi:hypothetical protein
MTNVIKLLLQRQNSFLQLESTLPANGRNGRIRFSIIKGNDNGCANISISLNLESMQVFDHIYYVDA